MTEFLLFTLYAPLASWGDIAVGEMRGTWDRPSRSAVLGIVAAALGITRDEQPKHEVLNRGYGLAVRLDADGTPLSDYHTAQTVAESIVKKMRQERGSITRADLMAVDDRETILSRRAYRQDAVATVAMWVRPGEIVSWSLWEIAERLERPVFVLYAGRKANSFGLPLAPQVLPADTLADALAARVVIAETLDDFPRLHPIAEREVAHDHTLADGFASGLRRGRRVVRRDRVVHRARWQFAERAVEIATPDVDRRDESPSVEASS